MESRLVFHWHHCLGFSSCCFVIVFLGSVSSFDSNFRDASPCDFCLVMIFCFAISFCSVWGVDGLECSHVFFCYNRILFVLIDDPYMDNKRVNRRYYVIKLLRLFLMKMPWKKSIAPRTDWWFVEKLSSTFSGSKIICFEVLYPLLQHN